MLDFGTECGPPDGLRILDVIDGCRSERSAREIGKVKTNRRARSNEYEAYRS